MTQETTNTGHSTDRTDEAWLEIFHIAEDCYCVVNGCIDYIKFQKIAQKVFDVRFKEGY